MRLASYLSTSRHGIFYFRWPIPSAFHPLRKRTDIKVSLKTRLPSEAMQLSRLLVSAGQATTSDASGNTMRYDDIRRHVHAHYSILLRTFRADVSANGPVVGERLERIVSANQNATGKSEDYLARGYPDGIEGLLAKFCALSGIKSDLTAGDKALLVREIALAYRTYVGAALEHNASFDSLDLDDGAATLPIVVPASSVSGETYSTTTQQYLAEGVRSNAWAAKTLGEKADALALLGEITGGKAVGSLTKADARAVKEVLMQLPRNRRKTAETRDLPLRDMLKVGGVKPISARTMNAYISNLQSFSKWAVDNGHADINVFAGTRIRIANKPKGDDRKAFTEDQLRLVFHHLTRNPDTLVKKDDHKWPALIAMFSGMRLNEVAQLQPDDVRLIGEVWCFDVNTTGDSNKSLKNHSSHRLVPVHQRLLDSGLLAFVEAMRSQKTPRLFPSLTYSKQNGYGRNAGRWFNDSFLPALGIAKGTGLMFHCLRHTMITRLAQVSEVPEAHLKALVGHIQQGVTYTSYFKAGFLPEQLQRAVNLFDFQ